LLGAKATHAPLLAGGRCPPDPRQGAKAPLDTSYSQSLNLPPNKALLSANDFVEFPITEENRNRQISLSIYIYLLIHIYIYREREI